MSTCYLKRLPFGSPALLLFIVPHTRMHSVWRELKDRCAAGKIDVVDDTKTGDLICARAGAHTLAISSWKSVLERLRQAASNHGHDAIERDILQLRGLTDEMNTAEFLPLAETDVADVNLPRRLINYWELLGEVIERLVADGIADVKGLRVEYRVGYIGRYVRLRSSFVAWFGLDLVAWRDYGITPIWWEIDTAAKDAGVGTEHPARIQSLLGAPQIGEDQWVYTPIRLMTGVERDRVVDSVIQQIQHIGDQLNAALKG